MTKTLHQIIEEEINQAFDVDEDGRMSIDWRSQKKLYEQVKKAMKNVVKASFEETKLRDKEFPVGVNFEKGTIIFAIKVEDIAIKQREFLGEDL